LEEKTLRRSIVKDIVKDSIQNTMDVYEEYKDKIIEYVENKRRENCIEITV
jgi:adenylate kinase family enzyme